MDKRNKIRIIILFFLGLLPILIEIVLPNIFSPGAELALAYVPVLLLVITIIFVLIFWWLTKKLNEINVKLVFVIFITLILILNIGMYKDMIR